MSIIICIMGQFPLLFRFRWHFSVSCIAYWADTNAFLSKSLLPWINCISFWFFLFCPLPDLWIPVIGLGFIRFKLIAPSGSLLGGAYDLTFRILPRVTPTCSLVVFSYLFLGTPRVTVCLKADLDCKRTSRLSKGSIRWPSPTLMFSKVMLLNLASQHFHALESRICLIPFKNPCLYKNTNENQILNFLSLMVF